MSIDDIVDQVKKGVDRSIRQVKRTAETVEAEARILALHRKVGLRTYQLWRAGQLSHPDLEADLEQIAELETRVDAPPTDEEDVEGTRVGTGAGLCRSCARPLLPGARFCTHCGKTQE